MQSIKTSSFQRQVSTGLALTGLTAAILSSLTCLVPFGAILLGIGGVGWLTRYSYLNIPLAVVATATLLTAFWLTYRRKGDCETTRRGKLLLWFAAVLAIGVNVLEHLILPAI